MDLQSKLEMWRDLQCQADAIAQEIKNETLKIRCTTEVPGAIAKYGPGRGKYDWEAIAQALEPSDALIARYSKTIIDWRKISSELGAPAKLKEAFFTPGAPRVTLKLL